MAENNIKKNKQGYGYKYTDLAQIHDYLESINASYYQYIESINDVDYIFTVPTIDGKEYPARRGCRVIQASLSGKSNLAQEQGSALTYARRYSLLMAFGLATEDDDGKKCERKPAKYDKVDATPGDITPEQMNVIAEELARTGVKEQQILDCFKHDTIAQFTKVQAEACITKLNGIKNKDNK